MCEGEEAIIIDNDSNAILYVSSDAYTLEGNLNVKEHTSHPSHPRPGSFKDPFMMNPCGMMISPTRTSNNARENSRSANLPSTALGPVLPAESKQKVVSMNQKQNVT